MKKSYLSAFTAFAMAMSMMNIPAMGLVAHAEESGNEGLIINKTAQLEDDGTYTINLDAFATGKVETTTTTTVTEEVVPTDIILVLDQSGSMVQNNVDGIPTGYQKANVKNSDISKGNYYYQAANGEYYKVTATKELVSKTVTYLGEDGREYQFGDLSTSWTASNGTVYNTPTPFVTASLKTFTRQHKKTIVVNSWWYTNDKNSNEKSDSAISAKNARENFTKKFDDDTHTVMLMNLSSGDEGYNGSDDNLNYTAAQYIAVAQKEANTYRYTYTYVDAKGKVVTIGSGAEGVESTVDNANASVELYSATTSTGTRLQALQYAAGEFVDGIYENAIANDVEHRVAVVGFASANYGNTSNSYYYSNTELFVGSTQYNYAVSGKQSTYNTNGNLAKNHYVDAFQSANTKAGYQNLKASVNALAGYGGTHPDLGFEMANGIFGASNGTYTKADGTIADRNRIVIFMTDGEPGDTSFDNTVANAAISQAGISKNTYKATVYTVGVLNQADANDNNTAFLKSTSSSGDYTLATGGADLSNFFQKVSSTITDTTTTTTTDVTLTKDAWLVDELSKYLIVPADFEKNINDYVTVSVAKHTGDHSFANPVPVSTNAGYRVEARTDSNGKVVGVNVSGFNFADENNWVSTSVSDGGSTVAKGNKLVVTIKGLCAKDSAALGTYVDTNSDASGIWDIGRTDAGEEKDTCVKAFPKPHTLIDKKLFVMDYAKKASLDVYDATKVDSAADATFDKVSATSTALTGDFGQITTRGGLAYTPASMNWNGYDTFYALGKSAEKGDIKTQNIWSKVSVLPANNVYYEDTFETNETSGIVGIEYTGKWTKAQPGDNAGEVAGGDAAEHGWVTSLADDVKYSDGTAAVSSDRGAKASFSFTGTGVDVYSRTTLETGIVRAVLSYKDSDNKLVTKTLNVDNLAQSNGEEGYYQIPTVSFQNLDYGTYTVTLTVGTKDGRGTYYLDGIRVYNPLSEEVEAEDATVAEAYGDEIGAQFFEVRDILLAVNTDDEGILESGAAFTNPVFIDFIPGEGTAKPTTVVATYNDYGPKNEVYLAKNQAISFTVDTDVVDKVSIGLKAPNGATKVSGSVRTDIAAASDMYYTLTPDADGRVVIKNDGENLLSVTKIKTCGEPAEAEAEAFAASTLEDTLAYAASTLSLDTPEDVIITNPDVVEPPVEETTTSDNWIVNLFKGLKKIFGR